MPLGIVLVLPTALLVGFLVTGTAGLGLALAALTVALTVGAMLRTPTRVVGILLTALPLLLIALLPATGVGGQRPYDSGSFSTGLLVGIAVQGVIFLGSQYVRGRRA